MLLLMDSRQLYQGGIDKQLVMELTRHGSVDGIRSYKQTSSVQREELLDILSLNKTTHIAEIEQKAENSAHVAPLRNQDILVHLTCLGAHLLL